MSKKNKQRVNINLDPINWVYARANEINLSQLLNDALREKRYHDRLDKATNEITYDGPECPTSFDPTEGMVETEKVRYNELIREMRTPRGAYDPFRGMSDDEKTAEVKRWNDERAAFEAIYLDPNVISLCETPVNNHGCRGFGVSIRVVNDRTGTVVAGYGCSSCWQVGHDDASSPIEVGTTVKLPEWCASWDEAKRLVGYSHNELVDDRDEPQPDTTRVTPYQLIK